MLDLSHIPNSQQDVQIFNANGSAWQTWRKPKKCSYVYIMCIGGAGGGGAGATAANGCAAPGASGGVSRALYNAQQLSDVLYVQVGLGGKGGIPGSTIGASGTRSWVALQPAVVAQNLIQRSGGNVAAGGGNASSTFAGETVITQTTANFLTLSNFASTAGRSTTTVIGSTVNINPLTSQITCAGAAGGGFGGPVAGSIQSSSYSPLIPGGTSTAVSGSNGTDGGNGFTSWKPFFSTGGAGGGAATSGSGGRGGDGGIGSGGGGGGAGATLAQGGSGGKGGDGLVIIISF
jgi:hypothetical protein